MTNSKNKIEKFLTELVEDTGESTLIKNARKTLLTPRKFIAFSKINSGKRNILIACRKKPK